jgi:hypothetical protein
MPMSGRASCTPGMEITGGSPGPGRSIAEGMPLGLRRDGNRAFGRHARRVGDNDPEAAFDHAPSDARIPGLTADLAKCIDQHVVVGPCPTASTRSA